MAHTATARPFDLLCFRIGWNVGIRAAYTAAKAPTIWAMPTCRREIPRQFQFWKLRKSRKIATRGSPLFGMRLGHTESGPEFIDQRGSFLVRFFNSSAETNASDHDATPGQDKNSPRPADVENTILAYCAEPRLAQEIANHVGRSLQYTRREGIRPMAEAGKLSLTLPDKPKSKYQRYRLTNAA